MDTILNNGEFLTDSRGRPIRVSGIEEILQKVLIRLTIKKGSFIYDTELGSNLYKLRTADGNLQYKALNLVREALVDMPEIDVENVDVTLTNSGENMSLTVYLSANNQNGEVEITL